MEDEESLMIVRIVGGLSCVKACVKSKKGKTSGFFDKLTIFS